MFFCVRLEHEKCAKYMKRVHDRLIAHMFPDTLEVWCTDFESHSEMSFIPAQRIHSQCLTVQYKSKFDYGREQVVVTIPLIGRFIL